MGKARVDFAAQRRTEAWKACKSDVLDKFISQSGKPFPAYLVRDKKGKITFEFPEREE